MTAITAESTYETERNKPMPSRNHGLVQANLVFELKLNYRNTFSIASELTLDLADWECVPDIVIYPKMEIDMKNDVISMTEPPLCAIEILLPTQSLSDLTSKADQYFKYGVKSCWIVLPSLLSIYVFSSPDDYTVFKSTDTLTDKQLDISFPLKDVFK
ncbi:MAG: Uma2 family endonuclease [Saprospiraceae bacterium]